MTGFIQLTDTHIVPRGSLAYGHSDTITALENAVDSINNRLPLLGEVANIIVTGDLTENGTAEEYALFRQIMDRLDIPYIALPGNHDERETMRKAFADKSWMPSSGPIQWRQDYDHFVLIGLDTLHDKAHYGVLCKQGFSFLETCLAEANGRFVVIATHHPWMMSGILFMDKANLRNGDQLLQRLENYQGISRMISGHVHRPMTTQIGKVCCQIAPSPCHAVNVDLRENNNNDLTLEPGAFTHYHWIKEPHEGLVSNVIPVGRFAGPWPFGV